jgi:hypothetical protein
LNWLPPKQLEDGSHSGLSEWISSQREKMLLIKTTSDRFVGDSLGLPLHNQLDHHLIALARSPSSCNPRRFCCLLESSQMLSPFPVARASGAEGHTLLLQLFHHSKICIAAFLPFFF